MDKKYHSESPYDIYKYLGPISETHMSCVYKSEASWGELVAVKHYNPQSNSNILSSRFKREIETSIKHRNKYIIEILDFDHYSHSWYVMPLAKYSLTDYIDKCNGKINSHDAYNILYSLSKGLEPLHKSGQVHRDLKPGNILYIEDHAEPRWVVSDFGIVRNNPGDTVSRYTQTGFGIGTADWAAPEQLSEGRQDINAHNVTVAADIYSCGLIAAHILARGNPSPKRISHITSERSSLIFPTPKIKDTIYNSIAYDPQTRPTPEIFFNNILDELSMLTSSISDCGITDQIYQYATSKESIIKILDANIQTPNPAYPLNDPHESLNIFIYAYNSLIIDKYDHEIINKFIDLAMQFEYSENWKNYFSKIIEIVVSDDIWRSGVHILLLFNKYRHATMRNKLDCIESIINRKEFITFFQDRKKFMSERGMLQQTYCLPI